MKRSIFIMLVAVSAFLMRPSEVHAEGCGILEILCWSGVSRISDRDAQRRENENALKVQGATQRAQIKADNDLKIAEAEKILQAQIANGKITVDLARIQMDSFKAQLDSDAKIQAAMIVGQSAQNIAALQGQTAIGVANIQEAGLTTRERMKIEATERLYDTLTLLPKLLFVLLLFIIGVRLMKPRQQIVKYQAPVQPQASREFDSQPVVASSQPQASREFDSQPVVANSTVIDDSFSNTFYPVTKYQKGEIERW